MKLKTNLSLQPWQLPPEGRREVDSFCWITRRPDTSSSSLSPSFSCCLQWGERGATDTQRGSNPEPEAECRAGPGAATGRQRGGGGTRGWRGGGERWKRRRGRNRERGGGKIEAKEFLLCDSRDVKSFWGLAVSQAGLNVFWHLWFKKEENQFIYFDFFKRMKWICWINDGKHASLGSSSDRFREPTVIKTRRLNSFDRNTLISMHIFLFQ